MRDRVKYSPEVADFIRSHTTVIPDFESGDKYHYIPFWFKDTGDDTFEVMFPEKLPNSVRDIIIRNRANARQDQEEGREIQPDYTGYNNLNDEYCKKE